MCAAGRVVSRYPLRHPLGQQPTRKWQGLQIHGKALVVNALCAYEPPVADMLTEQESEAVGVGFLHKL